MTAYETLDILTACAGVSGAEGELHAALSTLLDGLGEVYTDPLGSVFCHMGGSGKSFVLDAHIDRIGLIVKFICDDGFIKADPCGGMDKRTLTAQEVTLLCRSGEIKGVVTSVPPHLGGSEAGEESSVTIDLGLSPEEVKSLVSQGDRIIVKNPLQRLAGGRVTAPALDNRVGAAAVICAMRILKERGVNADVTAAFTVQEEVGCRGAKAAASVHRADEALVVDVSFALSSGLKQEECGKLSSGPMIGVSSTLSENISRDLFETAKKNKIPYQTEVMGGRTGTNADAISSASGGVATGLVSVPLKYMHSAGEVIDIHDVENTALLLADYICGRCE